MEQIVGWLLVHVVGPMALPFFMVALLCLVADVRPEPILGGMLKIVLGVIEGIASVVMVLVAPQRAKRRATNSQKETQRVYGDWNRPRRL